jgi:hypothetical protein
MFRRLDFDCITNKSNSCSNISLLRTVEGYKILDRWPHCYLWLRNIGENLYKHLGKQKEGQIPDCTLHCRPCDNRSRGCPQIRCSQKFSLEPKHVKGRIREEKDENCYMMIFSFAIELQKYYSWRGSRDSSVGIATGYELDSRQCKIFLFSTASRPVLGPIQPPVQSTWFLSPGGKAAGDEANDSSPSSAEVKKGGAILPLPHMSSWHSA